MIAKLQFYHSSMDKMVAVRTVEFDDFENMDRFAA